jgi:hypothetical protein
LEHSCVLCNVITNESGIYEDEYVKVLPTKNLKGHQKRVMVVSKDHNQSGWIETYMLKILEDQGLKVFGYTYKFVILATDFASTPDHPHYIASDLEPADDTLQVLGTRWVKVVDVRPWTAWKKVSPIPHASSG